MIKKGPVFEGFYASFLYDLGLYRGFLQSFRGRKCLYRIIFNDNSLVGLLYIFIPDASMNESTLIHTKIPPL